MVEHTLQKCSLICNNPVCEKNRINEPYSDIVVLVHFKDTVDCMGWVKPREEDEK